MFVTLVPVTCLRWLPWAFSEQPLVSRDAFPPDTWGECDKWFENAANRADEKHFWSSRGIGGVP